MNVLSTFDGMSCGQIALERAGIPVNRYFASEIDKHAIKVAQKNYPNTVQLGDIRKIKASQLPLIGLFIGGSPCQGFSIAGKGLNFDDPRSALFYEYLRLLRELKERNPDLKFLLENVKMKKEIQDAITELLGVEPVLIDSGLVSAQRRNRLYWTNIDFEKNIEDKQMTRGDILEEEVDPKYIMSPSWLKWFLGKKEYQLSKQYCSISNETKAITMTTRQFASWNGNFIEIEEDKKYRKLTPIECERLQTVPDNYTEGVSDAQRYIMTGNGWTVDVVAHIFKGLK